jgi:acyl-CoA synthetase (NDP forming)
VAEPVDVSGRPLALRDLDLDRFFRPRAVAVVGASDTEGKPNTGMTRMLNAWAERVGATVYPVNPGRDTVFGHTCYPSITDIPDDVDVAALLVGDPVAALGPVVEKKVAFAVVFAAGFAELGDDGAAAQQRLLDAVAGTDTHVLGPNTNLNAFEIFRDDLDGPAIALISQSGHQGRPIFQAQEIGIRLSHWAPTGNEADLEFADFVRYFAELGDTGAIAAYIEGFKDGRTLLLAADHAAEHGVPIVAVKVGRTDEGRSMAGSHTGKLTGSDAVISAAMRQYGVTRVDELDELLDVSQLLARAKPPTTDGVVVYAISGGTGAHMADLAAAGGLRLPELSQQTQEQLYEWIPRFLRVSNPVDNGGHPVGDWRGRKILDTLLADADVGALICPITGAFPPMSDKLAQDLVDVAETTDKPICVIWGSPVGTETAYRDILLSSGRIAVFRTFGNCVAALKAWQDWHGFRARRVSPFANAPTVALPGATAARSLLKQPALSEWDAKQVLAAYDIRTPREELVDSADGAVRAADAIGYPVVLKGCGAQLAHKSELGVVKVGLRTADEVRVAYAAIVDTGAPMDGVLVAEMVTGGVETVVGLAYDDLFGPVVMAGLGGVFVEVFKDVTFRVPPFDADEARRMLDELQGLPLLQGARGRPRADVDALVDVILKVQRMGLDLADSVRELDINPLVVLPEGQGAVALDALVVPQRSRSSDV